jgi:dTDP-4-amino-4,6-dideoxygalactose transaminase
LKANNIFGRRYFYPLISNFSTYRGLPSANKENLPMANRIANSVICLPIHHELNRIDIKKIISILKNE